MWFHREVPEALSGEEWGGLGGETSLWTQHVMWVELEWSPIIGKKSVLFWWWSKDPQTSYVSDSHVTKSFCACICSDISVFALAFLRNTRMIPVWQRCEIRVTLKFSEWETKFYVKAISVIAKRKEKSARVSVLRRHRPRLNWYLEVRASRTWRWTTNSRTWTALPLVSVTVD